MSGKKKYFIVNRYNFFFKVYLSHVDHLLRVVLILLVKLLKICAKKNENENSFKGYK